MANIWGFPPLFPTGFAAVKDQLHPLEYLPGPGRTSAEPSSDQCILNSFVLVFLDFFCKLAHFPSFECLTIRAKI